MWFQRFTVFCAGLVFCLHLQAQQEIYEYKNLETRSEYGKIEQIQVTIRKDLLIPLLEQSLSESGRVKVSSLQIDELPRTGYWLSSSATIPLLLTMLLGEHTYEISCDLYVSSGRHAIETSTIVRMLKVSRCRQEKEKEPKLVFPNDSILDIKSYNATMEDSDGVIVKVTKDSMVCKENVLLVGEKCTSWMQTSFNTEYY